MPVFFQIKNVYLIDKICRCLLAILSAWVIEKKLNFFLSFFLYGEKGRNLKGFVHKIVSLPFSVFIKVIFSVHSEDDE